MSATTTPFTLCGVPGTLTFEASGIDYGRFGTRTKTVNIPGTWHKQVWKSDPRTFKGKELIVAEVSFDDQCRNGHNSFAVTGHTYIPGQNDWESGGCIHDSIAKKFPELKHLIRWHLVDSDQPMYYVANTVYHASNLDNGKAAGEPNQWETRVKLGAWPISVDIKKEFREWLMAAIEHRRTSSSQNPHRKPFDVTEVKYIPRPGSSDYKFDPHYSFDDYTDDWYKAPFKSRTDAEEFKAALIQVNCEINLVRVVTGYSKGKERNLEAARNCAAWPEATDEQLCLPEAELKALLEARLPPLMAEFKADVLAAGLKWAEKEPENVPPTTA